MAKKSEICLSSFFIFNSKYGPREGDEHKKILFFHPPSTDIDTKIKQVGLCEAMTKFTGTFTDKPCQFLHTQKLRYLFHEPEKGYWIVMILMIPYSHKTKDGQSFLEYHEEDIQDHVYEAVLQQCYQMFKLFNGTIQSITDKYGVDGLTQKFQYFFSKYLVTLRLNTSDILDVFQGIHFLPLDKNTYLRIQCFVNLLESTFRQVKYTAFFYQDQLVWSGLEQEDMRVLYTYLSTSLFPAYQEQEFQGTQPGAGSAGNPGSLHSHYGKYLLGPPNLTDETNSGRIPRLYINMDAEGGGEECHLLVYKALSASLCLAIDGSERLTFDMFKRLDKFLGPQLSALASDIGDQYAKRPPGSSEPQFKYVYFNHMNLAQKTSIHSDNKKANAIPSDVLKLIADLNQDLSSTSVEDGETIVKSCTDCWVVSKKSDQREVYIILNQKNANLIEINEEVKRLCANHFNNIFFLD